MLISKATSKGIEKRITVVAYSEDDNTTRTIHFGKNASVKDIFDVLEEEFEGKKFIYACFLTCGDSKKELSAKSNMTAEKVADSLIRLSSVQISRKEIE